MDTPITVSSSLSSIKRQKKFVTPYSSSSVSRVPVSWDNSPKLYGRESNCTPTTLQKVNSWINSLNILKGKNSETRISSKQRSDSSGFDNGLDMEGDFPQKLVQSDFSKSELKEDKLIEDELNQYCSVIYGSSDEAEGSRSTPKSRSRSTRKHLHPKAIKRRKLVHVTNQVDTEFSKSDESDSDIPLSPESEKKKELCSYLQLMKPTDKKTVMILQNRRSVRVKNLNLMQEKRKLEKKLKEGDSVDTLVGDVNGDSCKELNVELDERRHRWLKYRVRSTVAETFQFPAPKDHFTKSVIDFDEATEEDWFKDWRKQRSSFNYIKSNSNMQENECSAKNEETNNTQGNSRLGLKRSCVVNQENLNDKKMKSGKKESKPVVRKVNVQKKNVKSMSKIFENHNILNLTYDNEDKEEKSTSLGFSMPKPSLYLATDIRDFGDAIQDSSDFIMNNSLQPSKVDVKSKTKLAPLKKENKMSPLLLENGVMELQGPAESNRFLRSRNARGESMSSNVESSTDDSLKFEKVFNESKHVYSTKTISSELKTINNTPSGHLRNGDFNDIGQVEKSLNKSNSIPIWSKKVGGNNLSSLLETKTNSIRRKNTGSEVKNARSIGDKTYSSKDANKLTPSCLGGGITLSRITNPGIESGSDSLPVGSENVGVGSKSGGGKPKSSRTEKKNKVKKSKSLLFLRRSSSFKIKFVTKKKNSISFSKGNQDLTRNNSELSSEDLGSPIEMMEGPCAKAVAGKKQNHIISNKQKIKNKMKRSVKNGNITENLLISSHKYIEEKNSEATQSSVTEIGEKLFDPPSQEPALPTELPKAENYTSNVPDLRPVKKTDPMGSSPDKNAEKRETSPPTEIMAVFKNHSNGITDISSELLSNNPVVADFNAGFHCQILNVEKSSEENVHSLQALSSSKGVKITSPDTDHLAKSVTANKTRSNSFSPRAEQPFVGGASSNSTPFILFKKDSGVKPLHRCLNSSKQRTMTNNSEEPNSPSNWTGSPITKQKKNQHSIHITREHGPVLQIFYMEYNLIVCQESIVSLWTQTALGNVLGAQNMWIKKGTIQRLLMNNNCTFKESLEMMTTSDSNVAYVELWTKEHQSDKREGPVADVFATVYFWKKGFSGLEKKVLQLENINGFADDVQYSVIKSSPKIVMSWHLASNELESKKTFIHCYELATDFQSVGNISEFESVQHYVSSLHNIEGCDTLIMGCGENKITLWNIEHGYVAATIEMLDIKSPLSTLWVKCDRGFLFTLQQCVDRELRLIAIHGMNHSWKKLASYVPPKSYDRLKGVCVENGIVLAFYDQGIICWNAQTAETVLETPQTEAEYISGKYIISIVNDQLNLKHAVTHLLAAEES